MADLLSHILVAHLVKRLGPGQGGLYACVMGSALPDLLGRVPRILLHHLDRGGDMMIPPLILESFSVAHAPIPFFIICALIAFTFAEARRAAIFKNLCLGGILHFLLDFFQTHIHSDIYKIFFPLSFQGYELGLIGTEYSLYLLPLLIPLSLAVEWRHRRA